MTVLPKYKVIASSGTTSRDVTEALESVSWEEGTTEIAARAMLGVDLAPGETELHDLLRIGATIQVYADDEDGSGFVERFRGRSWVWEFQDASRRDVNVIAYDALRNLTQSKDDFRYPFDVSSHQIIEDVCRKYGIVLGRRTIPDVKLQGEQYFRGKSVALVLQEVLMKSRMLSGGTGLDYYVVGSYQGPATVLEVLRPGSNQTRLQFTPLDVESMRDRWDMSDLITQVVIVGMDPPQELLGGTAIDLRRPNSVETKYLKDVGLLREILYEENFGGDPELLRQAGEQLLAERGEPRRVQTIVAPDVSWVRKGDMHGFHVGTLDAEFVCTGVHHDGTTGKMTLDIDASGFLGRYIPFLPPQGPGAQQPILPFEPPPGGLPQSPPPQPIQI